MLLNRDKMVDHDTVIVGLKRDLKITRDEVRELRSQNDRWRIAAYTLRNLAGLEERQFRNLLKAESLVE